jgi:hypothetical protein
MIVLPLAAPLSRFWNCSDVTGLLTVIVSADTGTAIAINAIINNAAKTRSNLLRTIETNPENYIIILLYFILQCVTTDMMTHSSFGKNLRSNAGLSTEVPPISVMVKWCFFEIIRRNKSFKK